MNTIAEWFRRVWYLLNRRRFDEQLRLEMEAHRECLDDAQRFGSALQWREKSRDVWGWSALDDLARDIRLAARTVLRAPGFSLTVVVTLALGLVLSICTFAVVNAYLIRALPYPAASRLYHVVYAPQGRPEPGGIARLDWKELAGVVEAADASLQVRLQVENGPVRREALGLSVSPDSMEMLGVAVIAGRTLEPADFHSRAEQAALVSASWWSQNFGGDPVGSIFRARRGSLAEPLEAFRVVGILPPDFRYARETARGPMSFVIPLTAPVQSYFVRLRSGVPVPYAEQRITEVVKRIATTQTPQWTGVRLESARDRYVSRIRPLLTALAVTSVIVLLAVTANLAVLFLLRSLRRTKEFAVRVALGAGSRHLIRMLALEALLLAGTAFAIGLLLSKTALQLLAPVIESRLGLLAPGGAQAISLDAAVIGITLLAAVLVVLLLSFVPLAATWKDRLGGNLRQGGRGGTRRGASKWLRFTLVATETGASLALLAGGALMVRTVLNLVRTDLGYETANVIRARIGLPARTYPAATEFLPFYNRLSARLQAEAIPFALANFIMLYETPRQTMEVEPGAGQNQRPGVLAISESYLPMFRIPVIQGRNFTSADRAGSEPVAIVSETLARLTWTSGPAIGRRIRTAEQPVPDSPLTVWRTVVGVTRDIRQTHTDEDLKDIYIPFSQAPSRYAQVFLKTNDPRAVLQRVQIASAAIDPQVQVATDIAGGGSLDSEAARLLAGPRFLMSSITIFAAFSLCLCLLGMYGLSAFAAQEREHEVAVRIAVGACPSDVIRLLLRESAAVLLAGIATGTAGAMVIGNLLRNQIFRVNPFDLATFASAALLLAATVLIATWWPARHIATVDTAQLLNEI